MGDFMMAGTLPEQSVGVGPLERIGGPRRGRLLVLGLLGAVAVLVCCVVVSLALGARPVSPGDVMDALLHGGSDQTSIAVRELRVPRTILGLLVGAAMAVSGALMQALSRNPLADPGILGVNSGAALAVVVGITLFGWSGLPVLVWVAMTGAGVATVVVYLLGSSGGGADPVKLTLAGTAVGAAASGVISAMVLLNLSAFDGYRSWTLGSLAGRDLSVAVQVLPFILVGLIVGLAMGSPLNALGLGDDAAQSLGVNVTRVRIMGVVAVTMLCGAATAAAGPIGFVGLVVPHMVRSFTGPDQRWLLMYCVVLGPVLVLVADIIGRLVLRPAELDASLVTTFIGAPVFIFIIRRRKLIQL